MRYRVRAWGSAEHDDLDYESDEYPSDIGYKYPYIDIARITTVSPKDIKDILYKK